MQHVQNSKQPLAQYQPQSLRQWSSLLVQNMRLALRIQGTAGCRQQWQRWCGARRRRGCRWCTLGWAPCWASCSGCVPCTLMMSPRVPVVRPKTTESEVCAIRCERSHAWVQRMQNLRSFDFSKTCRKAYWLPHTSCMRVLGLVDLPATRHLSGLYLVVRTWCGHSMLAAAAMTGQL